MDIKYSVDMVRLMVRLRPGEYQTIFDYQSKIPGMSFYMSNRAKDYHYNITVKNKEYGYWMGYKHNSSCDNNDFVLEYNPNKVRNDILVDYILNNYFNKVTCYDIRYSPKVCSVDIAVDIPINILNCLVFKQTKGRYMFYSGSTERDDDFTIYIGKGPGRVKLYNKAIESGLDYDLTRYEVSLKLDKPLQTIRNLRVDVETKPVLKIFDMQLGMDPEMRATINGFLQEPYLINQLSKYKRKKYREMIENCVDFKLDNKEIERKIVEYIDSNMDLS
jgi:hypothetical protein